MGGNMLFSWGMGVFIPPLDPVRYLGNKYCAKSPQLWRLLNRLSDPTLGYLWASVYG